MSLDGSKMCSTKKPFLFSKKEQSGTRIVVPDWLTSCGKYISNLNKVIFRVEEVAIFISKIYPRLDPLFARLES